MCDASAALDHHSSPHTSLVRVDPAPSPPASPADQIRGDVPTQGGGKLACDTRPFLCPSTHPPAGFFTDPPALSPTCRSSERRHTLARLGPELLCLDVCFVTQPQGKAEFSEGSGSSEVSIAGVLVMKLHATFPLEQLSRPPCTPL